MSADPRLLTPEQLKEIRKMSKTIPYRTEKEMVAHKRCDSGLKAQGAVMRALLDHIAALDQQRVEALEVAKTLPHPEVCASRRPLCGICDLPVLSAIGAFGTSHALRRSEKTCVTGGSSKTPNVVRTCDCCIGLLIEKLGGEK